MDKLKSPWPYVILAAMMVASPFIFNMHSPHISVAPEVLLNIGGFKITNALFTSWVCIAILVGVVMAGLQNMKVQPTGLQNLLEFAYEGIYQLTENVCGTKWVVSFFAVPATIFFYVLVVNLVGLFSLPLHGVGICEPIAHATEAHTEKGAEAHTEEHSMWSSFNTCE